MCEEDLGGSQPSSVPAVYRGEAQRGNAGNTCWWSIPGDGEPQPGWQVEWAFINQTPVSSPVRSSFAHCPFRAKGSGFLESSCPQTGSCGCYKPFYPSAQMERLTLCSLRMPKVSVALAKQLCLLRKSFPVTSLRVQRVSCP